MARPKGSRTVLVRITYDEIGRLAGIAGDTAKQYAQRGQFDSRDLDSLLTWVNARRTAKGLPLIGLPTEVGEAVSDDDSEAVTRETPLFIKRPPGVTSPPAPVQTGLLNYNPLTACYREDI